MPSQGPYFPGTVSQTNAGQNGRLAFDNPSNIQADDEIVAISATSPATYRLTYKLVGTDFGFTIPAGAVPVGFVLTFEAQKQLGISGQPRDGVADLIYNGNVVGQIAASSSDWVSESHSIGGASNLWGWTGASRDAVNDASFGVRIETQVPANASVEFDWIKLTVYYDTTTYGEYEGSGGLGLGGSGLVTSKPVVSSSGGLGLGGEAPAKSKPIIGGGLGLGGAADARKIRAVEGSGGLGLGYDEPIKKYYYGGAGGLGLGGTATYNGVLHLEGSGGLGLGGDALTKNTPIVSGGLGIGGAADFRRIRPIIGSGGLGIGHDALSYSKLRFEVGSGGLGLGGTDAISKRSQKYSGTGGMGFGGGARVRRISDHLFDGDDDPEDFERSHRGPVTRRMVYEAIRKVLVDGPLNDYAVYVGVDEPEMDGIQGSDNFAVIVPGSASNDQADLTGGGDIGTIRTDMCEVRIYSRKSTDVYPRSTAWDLRTDGAMERARQVRRVLNMEDLVDEAGWLLLVEPMRATNTGQANMRQKNPQVGYRSEYFEVVYQEHLG